MKTIEIPAGVEQLRDVTDFVSAELESVDCSMKARMMIELAIEEIFTNIACYSGSASAEISVEIDEGSGMATITFRDEGTLFDPLAKTDADIRLSLDEREIGGLGILLVKKQMDDVRYEHKDGKNVLTIQKMIR